ncbi:MAG: low molecular weight phosphotyrosine protein phosphatase [Chlamydiae bacterium]|nr:low molecular weight phosphotyrosine protein phosphatase [Chlamydiota bacterium]
MKKVLFVCLGNICRSPAQQYISTQLAKNSEFIFDSCAVSNWNSGDEMDPSMRRVLEKRGYSLPKHQAKVFQREYFQEFDYIFAATEEIYEFLSSHAKKNERERIYLATHFSDSYRGMEIPDPYAKGDKDFEQVVTMIEEIAKETLDRIS